MDFESEIGYGEVESWSLFGEDPGDESGQGDAAWIDEGEEEDMAGEGEDYPVLPEELARNQTAVLRELCAKLEALRREWRLANSRAYQAHVEDRARRVALELYRFVDHCFACELGSVGD